MAAKKKATEKKFGPVEIAFPLPSAAAMRTRSKNGRRDCVLEAMELAAAGGNLSVSLFDQQAPLDAHLTDALRKAGYHITAAQSYTDPDGNAKWVVTISWA